MIAKLAIFLFTFSCILSLKLIPVTKIYNAPRKEVTQDITKAFRNGAKTVSETSRKVPDKNIPQKNMCPPIDNTATNDPEFKECDKIKNHTAVNTHPDQNKLTPQILETYGYSYMEYRVRTEDGYILTIYRITGSPKLQKKKVHLTPVYVNHGIFGSSDWWFLLPPEKSLALLMADQGFDVWLANARGTTYSLGHEDIDHKKNLSYWEFSFHEMGIYDVPAVTDKILKVTERKNIIYLGMSMGTTAALISLSELPEMNDKIRVAFLLAPLAYMGHSPSILRNVATAGDTEEMYRPVNMALNGRIQSSQDFKKIMKFTGSEFCAMSAAKCGLCDNVLFALNGANPPQINRTALPLILAKMPNSVSYKTCIHFGQLITSCRFQNFEYNPANNFKEYRSLRPPLYNLRNVKTPLYIYHAAQDMFAIPIDVKETVKRFRSGVVQEVIEVPDPLFTHFDFQIAKDADKLIYKTVISHMKKHTENNKVQTYAYL